MTRDEIERVAQVSEKWKTGPEMPQMRIDPSAAENAHTEPVATLTLAASLPNLSEIPSSWSRRSQGFGSSSSSMAASARSRSLRRSAPPRASVSFCFDAALRACVPIVVSAMSLHAFVCKERAVRRHARVSRASRRG